MPTRKVGARKQGSKRQPRKENDPATHFQCKACGRKVKMPTGWGVGAASRRHYWAKHPEIMRGEGGGR